MTDNNRNENPNLAERVGTVVLDFDDRRRLAVSEMYLTAEQNGGQVQPGPAGQVILRHILAETPEEAMPLGDAVVRTLARNAALGGPL